MSDTRRIIQSGTIQRVLRQLFRACSTAYRWDVWRELQYGFVGQTDRFVELAIGKLYKPVRLTHQTLQSARGISKIRSNSTNLSVWPTKLYKPDRLSHTYGGKLYKVRAQAIGPNGRSFRVLFERYPGTLSTPSHTTRSSRLMMHHSSSKGCM